VSAAGSYFGSHWQDGEELFYDNLSGIAAENDDCDALGSGSLVP
jgi:hypothetical protein